MRRVSAAVLNWNDCERTLECLEALGRSEGVEVRALAVDNGSSGDDADRLARRLGDDRVLALRENRGYAGGMNAALAAWRRRGNMDPVLLITPDAAVEPDAVARLAAALEAAEDAGAVGPMLVYLDPREARVSVGGTVDPRRVRTGLVRRADGARGGVVDWIEGCCMLVRPEAVEAVGGFDERFFAYYEEVDLCSRLRRGGWTVRVASDAVVRHPRATILRPTYYYYYLVRNRFLFWRENHGIGAPRVAAATLAATARIAGSLARAALAPRRWSEAPLRARQLGRQIRGGWAGFRDHLRGRYGPMPGAE